MAELNSPTMSPKKLDELCFLWERHHIRSIVHIAMLPREMDKLCHLWEFHRQKCRHEGQTLIERSDGSGIGTTTIVVCGCGERMDVTDYFSW